VFILYAIPVGLAAGAILGGRLAALATIRIRLGWLAVAALVAQVILFSPLAGGLDDAVARPIYVASTGAVVLVVLANIRLTGMPIVLAGALSNLAAILANGGAMPADPGALAAAGIRITGASNSVVTDEPALAALTDRFATPGWLPFANVFSIGDVLIAIGTAVVIAAAMRGGSHDTPKRGNAAAR